jgi:arylsulfatase A-like enzyme
MTHANRPFGGTIGRTFKESTPWWPEHRRLKDRSPNILFVVLDDVGFSDLGCYGSEVETPHIDALACRGLRYTNFHVTPMCSPTRASLLTGRNSHAVGMGAIAEWSCGFPGYEGQITHRAATLAEILRDQGYNTMCVGKWHLTPLEAMNAAGPMDQWPTGRGFERWYGFHGALGDQWYPEMFEDNHVVDAPLKTGAHLSEMLADRTIQNIKDQNSISPDRPFFMYLAFGACHWPHHVPASYLNKYKGRYADGWDVIRQARYRRQKELEIISETTELAPRNPGVPDWKSLKKDQQRFAARLMEAYAGFLEHTDAQIGRVLNFLKDAALFDNTLVVVISDNGATAEGGETGSVNHRRHVFIERETMADRVAGMDTIGSEFASNCYPEGWAQVSNTPLKWYKKDTHGGGVVAPIIFHWPTTLQTKGSIRRQYHHVVDVMPTILDLLGIDSPSEFDGIKQLPVDGTSMRYTFDQTTATTRRQTQYYEILGDRAIWHRGWKAVARHEKGTDFETDRWELYHTDQDFSECNDLAEKEPEKLRELIEMWWAEAEKNNVLPLDDREWDRFVAINEKNLRLDYSFHQDMARIDRLSGPDITDRSFQIMAELDIPKERAGGVILAYGGCGAGYVLYVLNAHLVFEYVLTEKTRYVIHSRDTLSPGPVQIDYRFKRTGSRQGIGTLWIDGNETGAVEMPKTWGIHSITGGLRCGRDTGSPVSDAYPRPFHFNGDIRRVRFALEDDGQYDPSATYTSALREE